ncbi:MAG: copper chaperone PCu(A)C [Rhodospirillaceae bacterium]|nr:copper chaperone PCu(A)C [Rhodospirillaceae bacterium]
MKALIFAVISTLSIASPAFAEVTVNDAWVRATPGSTKITAAYATILNSGTADDVLTGIRTAIAGMAHLHSSTGKDGVMRMESIETLPVPAGKGVALTPGNYHVMIMDLKAPLKVGDEIPIIFTFENQGDVSVTAIVMPLNYSGASSDSGADHHSHN